MNGPALIAVSFFFTCQNAGAPPRAIVRTWWTIAVDPALAWYLRGLAGRKVISHAHLAL
jgi:hypothetical protein